MHAGVGHFQIRQGDSLIPPKKEVDIDGPGNITGTGFADASQFPFDPQALLKHVLRFLGRIDQQGLIEKEVFVLEPPRLGPVLAAPGTYDPDALRDQGLRPVEGGADIPPVPTEQQKHLHRGECIGESAGSLRPRDGPSWHPHPPPMYRPKTAETTGLLSPHNSKPPMGQFFKFMFASMLGFILGSIVLVFLLLIMIVGAIGAATSAYSFEGKPTEVEDNTILHMEMSQQIMDRGNKEDLMLDFGPLKGATPLGLNDILEDLEKAKTDDRIKGVFLDMGFTVNARMATVKEIRDKLIEFKKESGKPVIAYAEFYTQGTYYLASAADQVYLVPEGDLDFRGLEAELMFMKGLFDKLGIDIQFIRGSNNKFKSYGETFIYKEMSPENERQLTELIGGLWDQYLTAVGDSRKLDKARLNGIAENLVIREGKDALDAGMIDGLKYRDEVIAILKEKMGLDADKDLRLASLGKYARAVVPKKEGEKTVSTLKKPKIALVYAQGDIMSGESEDGSIGSTTISEAIRDAREDTLVKAIVLRVNSPGGSGLASDVIWREVDLARKEKPVVVSMGDLAASGGYYISCAANKIYAQPNTITGSIGVFGIIPNMQGLFNDKLGITFDGVKTNKYADMMTTSRALTAEEKDVIQGYVDKFYDTFKTRVSEGRMAAGVAHMTEAMVDSIGQGRVWTGERGKELGLVDAIGGLEDAIAGAAELAQLAEGDYRTVDYPAQESLFKEIMENLNGDAKAWVREEAFGDDVELLHQFEAVRKARGMMGVQARMPFDIEVH